MNINIFKGKTIDTGVWTYGGLSLYNKLYKEDQDEHCFIVETGKDKLGFITHMQEVIPETVCRFTNRYDIEGTPIYEYDILSNENYKNNYKVKYMNGSLVLVEISNEEHLHIIDVSHYFGIHYFKIVGNIHDNKEDQL